MDTDVLEVCRLCLSKDGLIWLFDAALKMPQNVLDVVQVTTGVKILKTDIVSQKICTKCCQITLKMYQFRTNALKHDRYLKNKVGQTEPTESIIIHICDESDDNKSDTTVSSVEHHPSIVKIQQEYPNLRLPPECLSQNVLPTVQLRKFDNDGRDTFAFARKRTSAKRKRFILDSDDDDENDVSNQSAVKNAENERKTQENENVPSCDDNSKDSNRYSESSSSVVNPFQVASQNIPNETPEAKFQKYFKSIGLVPSEKDTDNTNPMICGKSEVLSMCRICCKMNNSRSALKTHMQTHKKCRLCKTRYAGAHQIRCPVLNDVKSRTPQVKLTRVDFDKEIVSRYPSAFETNKSYDNVEEEAQVVQYVPSTQIQQIGNPVQNIQMPYIPSINISVNPEMPIPSAAMYPAVDQQGKRISSGLVKPDIKIKNDDFNIDLINPRANDIKIIKDLLILRNGNNIRNEIGTQTFLSDNCNIELNKLDRTCKFTNLKQQLLAYKLPIEIEYGDSLSVNFKYDEEIVPKASRPAMKLWGPAVELKQKQKIKPLFKSQTKFVPISTIKNTTFINTLQPPSQPKTLVNTQSKGNTNFAVHPQGNLVLQQPTIVWQTTQTNEQPKQVNLFQNTTVNNSNLLTSASTSNAVQPASFFIQHPSGQVHLVAQPTNASINLSNITNITGNQQLVKLKSIPTINAATTVATNSTASAKPKILNFLLSPTDVSPSNQNNDITLGNLLNSANSTLPTPSNTIMTPKILNTRSLSQVGTTNSTVSVIPTASSSLRTILPNENSTNEATNSFIRVKPLSDLR